MLSNTHSHQNSVVRPINLLHFWSATPKASSVLKNFLSNTLTAIFKHWMSTSLCWLCLSVFHQPRYSWGYCLKDTHPSPANTATIVGVSLWPRISILALNCLLAPHVSLKIFHVYESGFLMRNSFIKTFRISCSFVSFQRQMLWQGLHAGKFLSQMSCLEC